MKLEHELMLAETQKNIMDADNIYLFDNERLFLIFGNTKDISIALYDDVNELDIYDKGTFDTTYPEDALRKLILDNSFQRKNKLYKILKEYEFRFFKDGLEVK